MEDMDDCDQDSVKGSELDVRKKKKKKSLSTRLTMNPDQNIFFYWLLSVTICWLYNVWTSIVRQALPELDLEYQNVWWSCDAVCDIVYIADVVFHFRTSYLEQGLLVFSSKKLAKHYMNSSEFFYDLLSILPIDLLQFMFGVQPVLRFPRYFKMYRACKFYYMVESRTLYPNMWRVLNLVHILLLLAHWFGCFYYMISKMYGFVSIWGYPEPKEDFSTLTRKYLASVYWSTLTLTTIGDLPTPTNNAE